MTGGTAHVDPYVLARGAVEHAAIQKASELASLVAWLKGRRLRRIVEVGTAHGGTLWLWMQLAEDDATIVSVDLPGGLFAPRLARVREKRTHVLEVAHHDRFRQWRRLDQRLLMVRGDSQMVETRDLCAEALGGAADLVFIDADHSYAGCSRDVELYAPLLRDGGILALHDILEHPKVPACQVDRVWSEVCARGEAHEFCDPDDDRGLGRWGGIGAVILTNAGAGD